MGSRHCIIYSDLDATFLDDQTYSCEASLPALREALSAGMTAVFCSSKTRAEMDALLARLDLTLPFISENGGAVFIPEGFFSFGLDALPLQNSSRVLALGTPYPELVGALTEIQREVGTALRGFSGMTAQEIGDLCGLDPEAAELSRRREFDEPFVISDGGPGALDRLQAAIARRGLRLTQGGRFHHLTGGNDKGIAVRRLNDFFRREYGKILTVGLGDSANDLSMLAAVDRPVLVRKPDGTYDAAILSNLPEVERTPGVGPVGWAHFVGSLLRDHSSPPARSVRAH